MIESHEYHSEWPVKINPAQQKQKMV